MNYQIISVWLFDASHTSEYILSFLGKFLPPTVNQCNGTTNPAAAQHARRRILYDRSSYRGWWGAAGLSQLTLGESRGTPWTGHWFIAGPTQGDNHPHTLTFKVLWAD